jgi:hypothetical protein
MGSNRFPFLPREVLHMNRGILSNGIVVPDTEFVMRDEKAWWNAGERGARKRSSAPTILCGHWTGGPTREGPSAGSTVVRAMKARADIVGVHFVISWDGLVWQTADLATQTAHAGSAINARSIGVETCWPGTASQAARLEVKGKAERRQVNGRTTECLRPSDELIASWVRLADAISGCVPTIKRQVPAVADRRMTPAQVAAYSGALEHLHSPGSTKIDAACYLIDALRDAGWKPA